MFKTLTDAIRRRVGQLLCEHSSLQFRGEEVDVRYGHYDEFNCVVHIERHECRACGKHLKTQRAI